MTSKFSNRLKEAKELVKNYSVKRYIISENNDRKVERWVVVGKTREYLIMIDPYWCRCYDFQHNVLNNQVSQCKHNIAVQIALREDKYNTFHLTKEEYDYVRSMFLLS
ncbi:MAG: hypothetical protein JSU57_04605 [Candidatus Heimdallarchaeota archaeon]|nr:MAG: hypothetical protein JSU57_04605 [Candidatus Heimdallarchaeota archaeon]